ncbi:DUF4267 domain-containing protein [Caulobacter vibrioides]|uniref:DUF4267 domain-containing protein n=1 Tax=Caulobacter vibrioides TaxID=155892 RepID=UPI000BB4911D|nr:DUF4267 domain-containing protein [Caulobacter vibrioides]ATC25554.1 DUF4267 domain-containing protein [Caulobacter vibrioides]AZH13643.1 DUF4267 domain-containing protein [Caulobacter vibrioides]PLR14515.1 DUF4267 domain-containing protein [Caulobacter vibrioides]
MTLPPPPPSRPVLRTFGFWLSVPLALLQAVNVARALSDPTGFATYYGVPVDGADAIAWVQVYALRTAFVAALVAIFLVRRDLRALFWIAIAALILPLGDAWLTHQAGAAFSIVARHLATAGYLALTCFALFVAHRNATRAA